MATSYIGNTETSKISTEAIPQLNWEDLYYAKHRVSTPFQLVLDNGGQLICEEILRFLPGKRLVAFGVWEERAVAIKLFFERGKVKRHIERELNGIKILNVTKTPTPKLLYHTSCRQQKIQILIFEKISDARCLGELWQNQDSVSDLETVMKNITIELATQHVLGVEQKDLNLKNFLIGEQHIYTLDGGSIIQHPAVMEKTSSLNHLALFFAQLGIRSEALQALLFQTYIQARGWLLKKNDRRFLEKVFREHIEKRWKHYSQKIFRNSTQFARENHFGSLVLYDRQYYSNEFEAFFKNPESVFPKSTPLKMGRSSTVVKVTIDNTEYVIKRYNIKNIFHYLRRCLRPSRAANAWSISQRLRLFTIATPKPVAFIEKRFLGLRNTSYFVMEYSTGIRADQFFSNYRGDNAYIEQVAQRIVELFSNLAKLSLTHGDLKATNILIEQDQPVILDFDGVIEHPNRRALSVAFKKEMRRFMKNWENMPSVYCLFERLIADISL